jgi:hypothetical protein
MSFKYDSHSQSSKTKNESQNEGLVVHFYFEPSRCDLEFRLVIRTISVPLRFVQ